MSCVDIPLFIDSDQGLVRVASPVNHHFDVVFVHGLNGSRSKTWTNSNNEFWPSWLGAMIPTARIWTYGYKSAVLVNPTEDALELHCSQFLDLCTEKGIGSSGAKVVLVGHSLGGILIKAVCKP